MSIAFNDQNDLDEYNKQWKKQFCALDASAENYMQQAMAVVEKMVTDGYMVYSQRMESKKNLLDADEMVGLLREFIMFEREETLKKILEFIDEHDTDNVDDPTQTKSDLFPATTTTPSAPTATTPSTSGSMARSAPKKPFSKVGTSQPPGKKASEETTKALLKQLETTTTSADIPKKKAAPKKATRKQEKKASEDVTMKDVENDEVRSASEDESPPKKRNVAQKQPDGGLDNLKGAPLPEPEMKFSVPCFRCQQIYPPVICRRSKKKSSFVCVLCLKGHHGCTYTAKKRELLAYYKKWDLGDIPQAVYKSSRSKVVSNASLPSSSSEGGDGDEPTAISVPRVIKPHMQVNQSARGTPDGESDAMLKPPVATSRASSVSSASSKSQASRMTPVDSAREGELGKLSLAEADTTLFTIQEAQKRLKEEILDAFTQHTTIKQYVNQVALGLHETRLYDAKEMSAQLASINEIVQDPIAQKAPLTSKTTASASAKTTRLAKSDK